MDVGNLRGFNYLPSYAGSLQQLWTHFDAAAWRREVAWARRFGSNMLRVWLDWHAWVVLGEELWPRLDEALGILDENGLRMMPVLFNRWNDARRPMGMVGDHDLLTADWSFEKFRDYTSQAIERFGSDRRIGIWDLCNEPQAPGRADQAVNLRELAWMAAIADWVRRGSDIPVTIGTMTGDFVRVYAPLVDVISFHPYPRQIGAMTTMCTEHLKIAAAYGKPLICTETCCGSLNDAERGRLACDNIETLESHNIGWLAWQLCAGRFITARRDFTDDNAVRPGEGYMPFVLADGTTRPEHEWLERTS